MADTERPLAVVTGGSTGIGFELAKHAATQGFDLVIAADEPDIDRAAEEIRALGAWVEPVQADLATPEGVDRLYARIRETGRLVDVLAANAGTGVGDTFLNQKFADIRRVVNTNVTGTLYLLHKVGADMRRRGAGRILITGSIAGFVPGTYQAVYNATKAFLNNFAIGLRHEMRDDGVSVTCLMPGATDTAFFERADMTDSRIGQGPKDDPAKVARIGFEAMMRGDGDVVSGWKNKVQSAVANILPADMTAELHRRMAEPGSGGS